MNEETKDTISGVVLALAVFLLVVGMLAVVGKAAKSHPASTEDSRIAKVIIEKKEAVESHWNPLTDKQVIETNYYLIAEDGTYIEVSIGQYSLAKKGEVWKSHYWNYR